MLTVFLINSCVVALCVVIHYEVLLQLTRVIPRLRIRHRFRILIGVFGALVAHTLEIWVFALAYFGMHRHDDWGYLDGNFDGSLLASGYFSFTTYTTLGLGDIEPHGYLRYLTGVESLTGLVLITWTASFLYIEMTRNWEVR